MLMLPKEFQSANQQGWSDQKNKDMAQMGGQPLQEHKALIVN
jgi:hypothetical protein